MKKNIARLGGLARAKSLTSSARSRIARQAAKARWEAEGKGILSRGEIRRQVVGMLIDRDAKAYLFGSYARGEADPRSDVDLMIVETKLANPRLRETSLLRRRLSFDKNVDLIVVDQENFERWKHSFGTVQHEIYREGVRLV